MIRKLVLLDSFDIIWHAKITLHLVGPLKIYKWHVLLWIDKFEIHDKGIQKIKSLLITTALITLVSMHNRSEKKLYTLYIIQYYNNQFHIIKKKLHLFIPIKKKNNRATCLHPFFRLSRKIRERFVLFKDVFLQQVTHDIQHYPTCFLTSCFTNLHKRHCPKKIISLLINQS